MFRFFISILFVFTGIFSFAQKEGNLWYFGHKTGMDFNYTPPLALSSSMNTDEGCSVISDNNGNLLFYTDGITVWNKEHQVMVNGSGLFGNRSSTQSGVIVASPNSNNKYYIFTVDDKQVLKGFYYNIVDMNLNGGLGEIIQKNVFVLNETCEKITAIEHENKRDVWIVTRKFKSDEYYSYLLTPSGFNPTPVISKTGYVVSSVNYPPREVIGYMKASHDGKKIVATHYAANFLEFSDFDNSTGIVSNTDTLNFGVYSAYGVEFSPNNKYLYLTKLVDLNNEEPGRIVQYDISSNDIAQIRKSSYEVHVSDKFGIGAIQLAPDGKMYIAYYGYAALDVIQNPDELKSACNFVANDFFLKTTTGWGLPNQKKTWYQPKFDFEAKGNCVGDLTQFNITGDKYTGVLWDFGDPASGTNNNSTESDPVHVFSGAGIYTVTLYADFYGIIDTIVKKVKISEVPVIDLGEDSVFCNNTTFYKYLDVPYEDLAYLWDDGSSFYSRFISEPDTIWLKISRDGCMYTDTVIFSSINTPEISIDPVKNLCMGDTTEIDVTYPDATYIWNDGSTSSKKNISETGIYYVTVTSNEGCSIWLSQYVQVNNLPEKIDLSKNINACVPTNESYVLVAYSSYYYQNYYYQWSNGSYENTTTVNSSGIYYLTVTTPEYCSSIDTISVILNPVPVVDLGEPVSVCGDETVVIDAYYPNSSYEWSNGSTNSVIIPDKSGNYSVTITSDAGCEYSTNKVVSISASLPVLNLPADTLICIEDDNYMQVSLPANGFVYQWNDGIQTGSRIFTGSQKYIVTITSGDNCSGVDSVNILYKNTAQKPIAESHIVCPGFPVPPLTAIGENITWYRDSLLKDVYYVGDTLVVPDPEYKLYTFYVTQSSEFCKSNPKEVFLRVLNEEQSPVKIDGDSTICENSTAVLYYIAGADSVLQWSITGEREFYTLTKNHDGIYVDWFNQGVDTISVSAIDTNSCKTTRELIVNIAPYPKAGFIAEENYGEEIIAFKNTTPQTEIAETGRILRNTNFWYFGREGDDTVEIHGDTVIHYEYGRYDVTLMVENEFGCRDTISKNVFMDISCKNLSVPNAYAPDNMAEKVRVFQPVGCNLKYYEISIFDKWGNLIWYSDKLVNNQPAEAWDGKYGNEFIQSGCFIWKIEAGFIDGTVWEGIKDKFGIYRHFGNIVLVR